MIPVGFVLLLKLITVLILLTVVIMYNDSDNNEAIKVFIKLLIIIIKHNNNNKTTTTTTMMMISYHALTLSLKDRPGVSSLHVLGGRRNKGQSVKQTNFQLNSWSPANLLLNILVLKPSVLAASKIVLNILLLFQFIRLK